MEEKRKIRMPIGAAVACLLIVALLTVGIVAGAKFINNSLSASQTEKNASVQATSAPSGSNGTVGSSGDKTGDLPSDKLSYAAVRPDPIRNTKPLKTACPPLSASTSRRRAAQECACRFGLRSHHFGGRLYRDLQPCC